MQCKIKDQQKKNILKLKTILTDFSCKKRLLAN